MGALYSSYRRCDHLMCLMNNHAVLLLGFTLVARPIVGSVQTAVGVGAGTLDLQEFPLPDPQHREQTLNARTVRLAGLGVGLFSVRHSCNFL